MHTYRLEKDAKKKHICHNLLLLLDETKKLQKSNQFKLTVYPNVDTNSI